jgi:hypothetical protein
MAKRAAYLVVVLAAVAVSGSAHAQDDPACAKYQEPLAYNACLASHGPKATDLAAAPAPTRQTSVAPVPARAAPAEPARVHPGWSDATRRHGRVHMEFWLK